ncbi:MAG: pyridoxamine 5-phosphate oxidase-related FMN-binding protein [Oscillospiraceae bacterium]|nr:pyridoxamine 5-phosphate oxidase-related FMN-binding protein [Oscillospiraceae bacterium]
MKEVYDYLKKVGVYYLATTEGDQPRVRPFGTIDLFEDKLYIQTGKIKPVSKQMVANPKIEIAAMGGGAWIRIEATAVEDARVEAQQHMLDAYPQLQDRYKAGDGNTQIFYLKDATATIFPLGPNAEPKVIKF